MWDKLCAVHITDQGLIPGYVKDKDNPIGKFTPKIWKIQFTGEENQRAKRN